MSTLRFRSCASLFLLLIAAGCANLFGRHEPRSGSPTAADPRAQSSAAQQWARSPAGRGAPEVLEGNLIIRSALDGPNYEVLLDLRTGPSTPDGTADRVWVLQNTPPRRAIAPMRIDAARVYSRPGELIVAPPVGPYVIQFTLGNIPPGLMINLPPDWMVQREGFLGGRQVRQRWWGVGLIQRIGQWPLTADVSHPASAASGAIVRESGGPL